MKTISFIISAAACGGFFSVASLIATEGTQEWLLGAVVAAFISLFTLIVTPVVAYARKDASAARTEAKEARAEAKAAQEQSLECRIWRKVHEPIIEALRLEAEKNKGK